MVGWVHKMVIEFLDSDQDETVATEERKESNVKKENKLFSKPRWDKSWEQYRNKGWDDFSKMKIEDKLPLFSKDERVYDVLFAQQFDRKSLDYLCNVADKLRQITKTKEGDRFVSDLLFDKRAILVFNQPSSRTFLSFQNACHILGMKTSEIRDVSTSSFAKGESPLDSIRTFASYVHLMIMRMKEDGFVE